MEKRIRYVKGKTEEHRDIYDIAKSLARPEAVDAIAAATEAMIDEAAKLKGCKPEELFKSGFMKADKYHNDRIRIMKPIEKTVEKYAGSYTEYVDTYEGRHILRTEEEYRSKGDVLYNDGEICLDLKSCYWKEAYKEWRNGYKVESNTTITATVNTNCLRDFGGHKNNYYLFTGAGGRLMFLWDSYQSKMDFLEGNGYKEDLNLWNILYPSIKEPSKEEPVPIKIEEFLIAKIILPQHIIPISGKKAIEELTDLAETGKKMYWPIIHAFNNCPYEIV